MYQPVPVRLFADAAALDTRTPRIDPHLVGIPHQQRAAASDGPRRAHGFPHPAPRPSGRRQPIDDDLQNTIYCQGRDLFDGVEAKYTAVDADSTKAGSLEFADHTRNRFSVEYHGGDDEDRLVAKALLD